MSSGPSTPSARDLSARVGELIRGRVGTRADAAARSRALERGSTVAPHQIGIAFDIWQARDSEFEHPFFGSVLTGIKERAWAHGADLSLLRPFPHRPGAAPGPLPDDPEWYVRRCRSYGLAGLITFSVLAGLPEVQGVVSASIPCVAIDDYLFGARASHVASDNVDGACQAVAHLLSLGRRRVATLTGYSGFGVASDRRRGWEIEHERIGLRIPEELVVDCDWIGERAYEATSRLLRLADPPDAIFAQSDLMAVGALRAVIEAGLRVPEDVALVGFDDSKLVATTDPPLTSVRQDGVGLGIAAAEVLFQMIEEPDEAVSVAVVPVELVVRGSTVKGWNESSACPPESPQYVA
ncbi:MAG: substrate-binding domain-containing protein [Gaiellaceae bacterium]